MKNYKGIVIAVILLAGCSSLKITSTWKSQNVVARHYNKILVLGLITEPDRSLRENMENQFVNDLQELGYQAVSSLKEYGPKEFNNMDEPAAIAKLKNSGVDAVVTIVLLNKEKERRYVAGYITYSPYGYYYNRFWGYYGTIYHRIYEPGYYVTNTKYFWESNFYNLGDDPQLLYSVQTQSFDEANSAGLGHAYSEMIVKSMVKHGLLINNAH